MRFTVAPHPGLQHAIISGCKQDVHNDKPNHNRKDPHIAPSLSRLESETILYLPPLLSSLPPAHSHAYLPESHRTPYTETDLPDIDPVSLSLHKALHHFRAIDDKYASCPYQEAFNWGEVAQWMNENEEREWYVVAFRSRRREGSDGTTLYSADRLAHEEAVKNGGLIMYWYGVPDAQTGLNLATCIWQSRAHAVAANSKPKHVQAAKLAKSSFSEYQLERYVLRKIKGYKELELMEYVSGEVGW